MMDLVMRSSEAQPTLLEESYIGIIGAVIDDRGRVADKFIRSKASVTITLEYFPEEQFIKVNNTTDIIVDDFFEFFSKTYGFSNPVLIEATTLGFPEIFICSRCFMEAGVKDKLNFIYVEPKEYSRGDKTKRDFELSGELGQILSIPGAIINIDDLSSVKKGIFFLGYEGNRFERIYAELEKKPAERCISVFGVPAFKAGWEMNSFSKNINVLKTRSLNDGVSFCPANNPMAAYEILASHYSTLKKMEKMFVSPLGTKPASIGAALFVAEKSLVNDGPKAGILFDNPKRKEERTKEILKWHLYSVRS